LHHVLATFFHLLFTFIVVGNVLRCRSAVLAGRYADFKMTAQDNIKIESLLNRLVKEWLLYKGKWRKYNRVDFQTMLAMTGALL
jgi:hypothetical protein